MKPRQQAFAKTTMIVEAEISDLLANLVERSLVIFDQSTGRYQLTETLRAFSSEQLGEDANVVSRKHFEYWSEKAEGMSSVGVGNDDRAQLKVFHQNEDNLRAALSWAEKHEPAAAFHFAVMLGAAWLVTHTNEAKAVLSRLLDSNPNANEKDRIWARILVARACNRVGHLSEAEGYIRDALTTLERLDMPVAQVTALLTYSYWNAYSRDWQGVQAIAEQALEISVRHGLDALAAESHIHLGELARFQKNYKQAELHYRDALRYAAELSLMSIMALNNLGVTLLELGRHGEGAPYFLESIRRDSLLFPETGFSGLMARMGLACVWILQGGWRRGGLLAGYCEQQIARRRLVPDSVDQRVFDRAIEIGHERWGDQLTSAIAEGHTLSKSQADELLTERE